MLANHWCASVDATIQLRTGCNPLEQHGPQAVIVHAIRALEKNPHSICLESSILEVMDAIFGMAVVSSAHVLMHKPHVYNGQGTPAISLSLTREQWARTKR